MMKTLSEEALKRLKCHIFLEFSVDIVFPVIYLVSSACLNVLYVHNFLYDLPYASYSVFPVLYVLSCISYPVYPILHILSCIFYTVYPILYILSCISYPVYHFLYILFCISYPVYPILYILPVLWK